MLGGCHPRTPPEMPMCSYLLFYLSTLWDKKTALFYFLNNSHVKPCSMTIIFGIQIPE